MLTDAQVYCMTSMIYLFRPPLTAKAIYKENGGNKVVHLIYSLLYINYNSGTLAVFLHFMKLTKYLDENIRKKTS